MYLSNVLSSVLKLLNLYYLYFHKSSVFELINESEISDRQKPQQEASWNWLQPDTADEYL